MADDRSREEPRVSRSGRVLKKSLKMKEMEDFEIQGDTQTCGRTVHTPMHPKEEAIHVAYRRSAVGTYSAESSESDTSSAVSSDISGDHTSDYNCKSRSKVAASGSKTSEQLKIEDDVYLSDDDKGSTNVSSEEESNSDDSNDENKDLTLHLKHRRSRKNLKRNDERYQEHLSAKRKTIKGHLTVSKRSSTGTMAVKNPSIRKRSTSAYKHSKAKESGTMEEMNRQLIVAELCRRMGGIHPALQKKKICLGKARRLPSQWSINSNNTRHMEETEGVVATKLVDHRVRGKKLELREADVTLGIAPIDVAAHLKLLGDNLTELSTTVSRLDYIWPGVYSVLLDILLCSVGPLLCLTREIAGLEQLPEDVFAKILDHIAYFIPGPL